MCSKCTRSIYPHRPTSYEKHEIVRTGVMYFTYKITVPMCICVYVFAQFVLANKSYCQFIYLLTSCSAQYDVIVYVCLGRVHPIIMKAYRGIRVNFHTFFILPLDGTQWSDSCSAHFTPQERATSTHWVGGVWTSELVWA